MYAPPLDKDFSERTGPRINGVAEYVHLLKENMVPDYVPTDSSMEKSRKRKEMLRKKTLEVIEKNLTTWNPENDDNIKCNPFNTLFVGRLSYFISERKLSREFERYGRIKHVTIVRDLKGQSRGYGFIEFEREQDLKYAYKDADGIRIDGWRIVVDIMRSKTVRGWKPKRMGGGLGYFRRGNARLFHGRDPNARKVPEMSITSGRKRSRSIIRSPQRSPERRELRRY